MIHVRMNLDGIVKTMDDKKIKIYSPDAVTEQLSEIVINDKQLEFVIPQTEIYNMIVIN